MSANIAYSREVNLEIWRLAQAFLREFDGVTDEIIARQLNDYIARKPKTITGEKGVFFELIESLVNQRQVPNTITPINRDTGERISLSRFNSILFNFDPIASVNEYDSWEKLFDKLQRHPLSDKDKFKIDNPHNTWVKFSKGILDSARFLSRFKNDINSYQSFLDGFASNEYSRLALPLLLEKEIHFMGFALACNFLKETTGKGEYVKPDTHIIDIFFGLQISKNDNPYEVFKDTIRFAESIGQVPYRVDKAFWLIGSRKFYLSWERESDQIRAHRRCATDRTKEFFIQEVKSVLSL